MLKIVFCCLTLFSTALSKWTFIPVSEAAANRSRSYPRYSESFARNAVYLCYSSYQPYDLLDSWQCSYCKNVPKFQLNDIHEPSGGDLRAYSGYDPVYDQIVFAFRGTCNLKNWVTDADFAQVDYPGVSGARIHRGFYSAWKTLKPIVLNCVETMIKAHPYSSLLVTGHSLGAALAQVAAMDIIKEAKSAGLRGTNSVMTFGTPRWGNPVMADYFKSVVDVNWRLVNKNDKIPPLPPTWVGYQHTTTEVWYTSTEPLEYTLCNSNDGEDPGCYYTYIDPTWNDHTTYLNIKLNF